MPEICNKLNMNNNINERNNENYINNELYGINLMLVYCVYHGECYIRKCSIEDCEKYEVPLKYKAPHAKYLGVCDETDLYNMGILNFYEDKETNTVTIKIIQKIRIDYTKFVNGTEFSDFYNKHTEFITDEYGNEIVYKNNNLVEWFEYIQSNIRDFGNFLNKGETYFK
jgi:hypothetical protein